MARTSEQIKAAARASGNPAAQPGYKPSSPLSRILGGVGQLLKGGNQPKLGDKMPQAPDLTGNADIPAPGEAGQAAVATEQQRAQAELDAQKQDQARALELGGNVQAGIDATKAGFDATSANLEADQQRVQQELQAQQEQLQKIPEQINTEFNQLRSQFDQQASTAFDQIDTQREAALGGVMKGQSMAMQAAVQGIQGNVNSQVANIQANPNLTDAQKQSMIAQVKLSGASSMAPAIGQTVLQFNQLAADTATKFASITGAIQSTVLTTQGNLIGMQGQEFAKAQTAVGQMTNQLLEMDANSSVAFGQAQVQLQTQRSQAEMMGNDVLLRLLPEESTPYADFTGAANMQYNISNDILKGQFAMDLQSFGAELQLAMIRSMQGNPIQNLIMGALQGFATFGGPAGAILGGAGGLAGSMGPQI